MGKRSNGEGTIRCRKDGRWEGRYTAGHDPLTGKQIQKNVLAKTQKECREKLRKAIEENEALGYSKEENYTIEQWVRLWFKIYEKPTIKKTTANQMESFIEIYIVPMIGNVLLRKFTPIMAQTFINDLKNTPKKSQNGFLSSKTVKEIFGVLKLAMKQAVVDRQIMYNPCEGCKLPKIEKQERHVLPIEKMSEYLSLAKERGFLPLFYLELTTGLRRGEVLALEWKDLNVDTCELSITKGVSRTSDGLEVSTPKTRNSIRTITITPEAVELLVEEHNKHPNNELMFPSPKTGGLRDPDSISRVHKRIAKRIGEEGLSFHDLRHTYTTNSIMAGVDIKTLSKNLGHANPNITLDIYSHVTNGMKKEAANQMSQFMQSIAC